MKKYNAMKKRKGNLSVWKPSLFEKCYDATYDGFNQIYSELSSFEFMSLIPKYMQFELKANTFEKSSSKKI